MNWSMLSFVESKESIPANFPSNFIPDIEEKTSRVGSYAILLGFLQTRHWTELSESRLFQEIPLFFVKGK